MEIFIKIWLIFLLHRRYDQVGVTKLNYQLRKIVELKNLKLISIISDDSIEEKTIPFTDNENPVANSKMCVMRKLYVLCSTQTFNRLLIFYLWEEALTKWNLPYWLKRGQKQNILYQ